MKPTKTINGVMRQLLLLIALLAAALPASAKDNLFFYNDLKYKILSEVQKTVAVITNGSDYYKYSGDIVIPETVIYAHSTYTVTEIDDYAFQYCNELTSVTIPNSVTSIARGAFQGCSALTKVTIGNSVTTIGLDAFHACTALTDVTIGNSVKTIDKYAFTYCNALASIDIPDSVIEIEEGAFWLCGNLKSVSIGNSVKTIGQGAFQECTALTSIEFPESVTKIGNAAFMFCNALTSVEIGKNVEALDGSFASCKSLTSIVVSKDNPNYSSDNNVLYNKDKTELLCYPAGIKGKFDIPNSVTTISGAAFLDCSALTSVTIPNSVTYIGDSAFSGCSALTSIDIPNSVTTIGSGSFVDCSSLKTMTVGNSLENLTNGAFRGCSSLTEINVSSNNPHLCSENGIVYSKDKSKLCCYPQGEKGSFSIPNTVTSIGDYAFYYCSALTDVTIPNSVTSIGDHAFSNCYALTEVAIPNSVTSIGDYAFGSCSSMTTMTVDMTNISTSFAPKLKTLILTESVESIGEDCRFDIEDAIYCMSKNPPACIYNYGSYKSFLQTSIDNAILYVPAGRGFKYVVAEGWKEFKNVEEMDSGVEDVVGEEAVIRAVDGCIVIDGAAADAPVEVYDMTGKAVYHGSAAEIPSMPRGIYIVSIGGKSVKVAV